MSVNIPDFFGSYFFLGVIVIIALFLGWLFDRKMKHKEKLIMLEKGISIEPKVIIGTWSEKIWLRLGIVFVLGGIGSAIPVIVSFITENVFLAVFTAPSFILFAGVGFIIAQYVARKG